MNDDLISREALKKDIMSYKTMPKIRKAICEVIDNAPTVDIKDQIAGAYNEGYMCGNKEAEKGRPQGEWLKYGDHAWKCSKCNCSVYVRTRNFCPDCGAKMRGLE